MTADQVIELIKEYGPAMMTVVGSVASAIFTALSFVMRWLWKKHKSQMKSLRDSIDALAKALEKNQADATVEHINIKETMNAYRGEMHLLKLTIDPLKGGLLKLEGAISNQNDTINRYVEKMGIVSGKLDAVFRFMDAPTRSSDINGR